MDDQELWKLLGRAPRPMAPPFFAAKVMRQIEADRQPSPSWLSPLWRWAAPAAIAALVLFAVLPRSDQTLVPTNQFTTLDLVELVSPEDYEILTTAGWPYDNGFLAAGL